MIRTVAIVFGDNDYGDVFTHMLGTIKDIIHWFDQDSLPADDKQSHTEKLEERIREFIKLSGMSFYIGFNNWSLKECRYDSEEKKESLRNCLSEVKVLFDEEAEQDILNEDHGMGAWYLEVDSGVIKSY
jgi:hypothetical protein